MRMDLLAYSVHVSASEMICNSLCDCGFFRHAEDLKVHDVQAFSGSS
jgi:hypothetical protein